MFITHHTEAREVDEESFFKLGESGGTKVSSAYQLALDIIRERFDPQFWNIYPFHFSDGDNWGDSDNKVCMDLVHKTDRRVQHLRLWRDSTVRQQFEHADVRVL